MSSVTSALVVLPLLASYAVAGFALQRIARRRGVDAIWAWLPPLTLLLPFKLAERSLAWGLLLLLPPVNFVVWTLAWAEAFDALGKPRWPALGMCVPFVNLFVLARLADLSPSQRRAAFAGVAATLCLAVAARAARERQSCRETLIVLRAPGTVEWKRTVEGVDEARTACDVTSALRGALDASDEDVRVAAVRALGRVGSRDRSTLDALRAALADEALDVRGHAALALWRIGRAGPATATGAPQESALPALLHLARGSVDRLMPDAELVDALASAGPDAVAPLVAALSDPDAGVRWHAAAAVLQLGPAAHAAAAPLRAAMDDEAWVVRNAAGRALEEAAGEDAVPLLVDALGDASSETRYHAARALLRLGLAAAPAVSTLTRSLGDGDWEVRLESARALAAVGPAAQAAVPALIEALDDPEPQVRMTLVWSIAKLGGSEAKATQALRAALDDRDREVRDAAAQALARRGEAL